MMKVEFVKQQDEDLQSFKRKGAQVHYGWSWLYAGITQVAKGPVSSPPLCHLHCSPQDRSN